MNAITRRRFVHATGTLLAAPAFVPARLLGAEAPSKQITVGFIGTGDHGTGWNLRRYVGFKDARVPMLLNVVAYWLIGFPLAYGFGVVLGQGVRAVWTGLIAGLVVCAVLLSWRYALITRRAVAARAVQGNSGRK